MLSERNSALIHAACKVYLKPLVPAGDPWSRLYATPSSISWRTRSRESTAGISYETTVSLDYPGMGALQFKNLDRLVKRRYEVQLESDLKEVYKISDAETPAVASYAFRDFGTQITLTCTTLEHPYAQSDVLPNDYTFPQTFPIIVTTPV